MRMKIVLSLTIVVLLLPLGYDARAGESPALADRLSVEKDHAGAAVEYRRLAHASDLPTSRAAWHWAAALEYWRDGDNERAVLMLDKAESIDAGIAIPTLLLRGETALADGNFEQAIFYWQGFRAATPSPDAHRYATRNLAAALVAAGNAGQAYADLRTGDGSHAGGLRAIEEYRRGRDKSPMIGGLLGIIPGLGHIYSGEYGNAVRSMLLNGIFIAGMLYTADDEQWGAFAVVSFFELTWYSGSIYGGIDAAQRYNMERREACMGAIRDNARFEADTPSLPIINLNYKF